MRALRLIGAISDSFMFVPSEHVDLMKPLHISSMDIPWESLDGKTIKNKNVILSRYGDIHPRFDGPIFECETLFLDCCDKNFLAYWLTRNIFPKVQKLYLGSHPCDFYTLILSSNENGIYKRVSKFNEIFLTEDYYRHYKARWWPDIDNIESITKSDYEKEMASYECEEMLLEKI